MGPSQGCTKRLEGLEPAYATASKVMTYLALWDIITARRYPQSSALVKRVRLCPHFENGVK